MHMTKGHFELIARVIRDTGKVSPWTAKARDYYAESMADALHSTNPNFDRAKFLAACGVEE